MYQDFAVPVSVSDGVASTAVSTGRDGLLRDGSRALHAGRRLGRDRCIAYDRGSLELLDEPIFGASYVSGFEPLHPPGM